jgi:hypothetical protein
MGSDHMMVARWARAALGAGGAALLLLTGAGAQAGEAGKIIFVSGQVQTAGKAVALGDAVSEGDEIATGADGYMYLKTIDDGLLILRPSSRARIVAYHIDSKNPQQSQVKLELLAGVARSVSGTGVKQARQNFRFNTPVAAIGVRGTDFTVFTDQSSSTVTVLSGAIVVSGFSGSCAPGGTGPCEHALSRELAAGQMGKILQVRAGQPVPQLLSGSAAAPDVISPPRSDEPSGKDGGPQSRAPSEPSLDPRKATDLLQQGLIARAATQPDVPVQPTAPEVVGPTEPASQLVWGRWAQVITTPANLNTAELAATGATRVAMNSYYAIYRTQGAAYQAPLQGNIGFALNQSEAFIRNQATSEAVAATLSNGVLQVDFGKSSFATSFDLTSGTDLYKLQATGVVTSNGLLAGNPQSLRPTNMQVDGALGTDSAAYIFTSRLDDKKVANGVTYWGKIK